MTPRHSSRQLWSSTLAPPPHQTFVHLAHGRTKIQAYGKNLAYTNPNRIVSPSIGLCHKLRRRKPKNKVTRPAVSPPSNRLFGGGTCDICYAGNKTRAKLHYVNTATKNIVAVTDIGHVRATQITTHTAYVYHKEHITVPTNYANGLAQSQQTLHRDDHWSAITICYFCHKNHIPSHVQWNVKSLACLHAGNIVNA